MAEGEMDEQRRDERLEIGLDTPCSLELRANPFGQRLEQRRRQPLGERAIGDDLSVHEPRGALVAGQVREHSADCTGRRARLVALACELVHQLDQRRDRALDHGQIERLFAREVAVGCGDVGLGERGDLARRGRIEALLGEHDLGCVEDPLARLDGARRE